MVKYFSILCILVFTGLGSVVSWGENEGLRSEEYNEDNCLDGQDMNAEDIDISHCPAISGFPNNVKWIEGEDEVRLGAWELGMTVDGDTYKYGHLNEVDVSPRVLHLYGEEKFAEVDELNIQCWAKGYYRLRKILQNPPEEYIQLRNAGFQTRFFQFQTDLRNGNTGFKKITSYMDHLVKWVTLIQDDECVQPTYQKFKDYAAEELERRGLTNDEE